MKKKINLWLIGYRIMWTIRALIGLAIIIGIIAILIMAGSILLIVLAVFFVVALICFGYSALQSWLKLKAKEKDLETRC